MKKEGIQKRKRKPKNNASSDSHQMNQSQVVGIAAAVHNQQLQLALQPHQVTQTHHQLNNSHHTHHTHHLHQQHVHHNNAHHSNQGQLHSHNNQHMLGLTGQLQQQSTSSASSNSLNHLHQTVSNGSNSHHTHSHPSHSNLAHVSKDLILNQHSNGSNSTNGNVTTAHLNLNRALQFNKLDDLTMAMAAAQNGTANSVLPNLQNSSGSNTLNANNLIIVDSNLHPLTKFSDVLYHQSNQANLGHASGHHLEHSLSSNNGDLSLSSEHSPNSEVPSPNTPSSVHLTRQVNLIPVEQFFYQNANVKVEAKN